MIKSPLSVDAAAAVVTDDTERLMSKHCCQRRRHSCCPAFRETFSAIEAGNPREPLRGRARSFVRFSQAIMVACQLQAVGVQRGIILCRLGNFILRHLSCDVAHLLARVIRPDTDGEGVELGGYIC